MAELRSNLGRRVPLARGVWLSWLLMVVLVMAGCSTPLTATRSVPTHTPFPTPEVIPTITPNETATPFPSAPTVAYLQGSKSVQTNNWTGVSFPTSDVTGVQVQWREPLVTNPAGEPDAAIAISVGVGGYGDPNNVVEVGTFVWFPANSAREEGVFYQMIPAESTIQPPAISVSAGDYLFAEVVEVEASPQKWRLLLVDSTSGVTLDRTVQFDSLHTNPDVIVADPSYGATAPVGGNGATGHYHPFPSFDTINFYDVQIRVDGAWVPGASRYCYNFDMQTDGEQTANTGLNITSAFNVIEFGQ